MIGNQLSVIGYGHMDQSVCARNLRELVAYRRAFNVSRGIFDLSKGFPEEGENALTGQIRQAHESPRVILRSTMKTTKIPDPPITAPIHRSLITDYRLLITSPLRLRPRRFYYRSMYRFCFRITFPERGGCVLSISRVSPGCVPSLGFRLGT